MGRNRTQLGTPAKQPSIRYTGETALEKQGARETKVGVRRCIGILGQDRYIMYVYYKDVLHVYIACGYCVGAQVYYMDLVGPVGGRCYLIL